METPDTTKKKLHAQDTSASVKLGELQINSDGFDLLEPIFGTSRTVTPRTAWVDVKVGNEIIQMPYKTLEEVESLTILGVQVERRIVRDEFGSTLDDSRRFNLKAGAKKGIRNFAEVGAEVNYTGTWQQTPERFKNNNNTNN